MFAESAKMAILHYQGLFPSAWKTIPQYRIVNKPLFLHQYVLNVVLDTFYHKT